MSATAFQRQRREAVAKEAEATKPEPVKAADEKPAKAKRTK